MSHSPLFQVMFILQNAPFERDRAGRPDPAATSRSVPAARRPTSPSRSGRSRTGCRCSSSTTPISSTAATVERLRAPLQRAAGGVRGRSGRSACRGCRSWARPSGAGSATEWNDTATRLVPEAHRDRRSFEAEVARAPEAIAARFDEQRLTYRELDGAANRLARHLRRLGVGPDALVGVCVERSLEMLVAVLAVLKAGGAYVPLDPAYPPDRLEFMMHGRTDRPRWSPRSHCATGSRCPPRFAPCASIATPPCLAQRAGATIARPRPRLTTSRTSSTRRARPGGRRACRSSTASLVNFLSAFREILDAGPPRRPRRGHHALLRHRRARAVAAARRRRSGGDRGSGHAPPTRPS